MQIDNFSLNDLLGIAKKVQPQLSFWGTQYVTISGSDQILLIDDLAERVMQIVRQNWQFSEEDRAIGKELSPLITGIYDSSDELVSQSNCITKLLMWVREFFCWAFLCKPTCYFQCSPTRWAWKDCASWNMTGACEDFNSYTREQYNNVFGHYPKEMTGRSSTYEPDRWRAPIGRNA